MKAYEPIVGSIVRAARPRSILDLPSGGGWLRAQVDGLDVEIDGIDLYEGRPAGYRNFMQRDLEDGVPDELGRYDMIVSCEGIEHIANPGLFLKSGRQHLNPGGTMIVTTPNTWHPAARWKYFWSGFFPSFRSRAGRIQAGRHMHIMPWSWPQLYLHMKLAGFSEIRLHPCVEPERTHLYEKFMALPMRSYCRRYARNATDEEVRNYWNTAAGPGALFARRLIVSGRNPD
jgi:2-polyprenyl-3-methyl-5-hydroxy-6-metoxy-1,4-benzoquinol methylase